MDEIQTYYIKMDEGQSVFFKYDLLHRTVTTRAGRTFPISGERLGDFLTACRELGMRAGVL